MLNKNGGLTISRIPTKLTIMEMKIADFIFSLRIKLAIRVVHIGVVKKIATASLNYIILIAK